MPRSAPSFVPFLLCVLSGWGTLSATPPDVELPAVSVSRDAENSSVLLKWSTVPGQKYGVERSSSLNSANWQQLTQEEEAADASMSYSETSSENQMFYRVAVFPDDFQPSSLSPTWQLDAQTDLTALNEGDAVSQWPGTGITSSLQAMPAQRPVFKDGSVVFDGIDDQISLPMWNGGVGPQWTLAVLMKLGKNVQDFDVPFGGDFAASRDLEFYFYQGGLYRATPTWDCLINQDFYTLTGNDDWRILILRSDGTQTKVSLDWYQGAAASTSAVIGQVGNFNLGCSYDTVNTPAPVSFRYMSFFPTCLSDDDTVRMTRWMERKKDKEYPPVSLFYGGGQSNFLTTQHDLRKQLTANFENTAFAFGGSYGGRPLTMWMKDNDQGTGFEVCPRYDLSAAPPDSLAAYQSNNEGGTVVLSDWALRESAVAKNPKALTACIFVQGESDTADARYTWKPNGDRNYNLVYADPQAWALSYGKRAAAWNAAIRQETGHQDMFFVYERVSFGAEVGHTPVDDERVSIQQQTLLEVVEQDPRWFQIDTQDLPKSDGIHLTRSEYQPEQVPNTGAERFARSTVRLMKRASRLASLSLDARMLAMRAIDSGLELDEAGFVGCEAFASTPGFKDLRSLVIPTLPAVSAADQATLRRCNLLLHLGGRHAAGFVPTVPENCSATCVAGADLDGLRQAIGQFLLSLGVSGPVSLSVVS